MKSVSPQTQAQPVVKKLHNNQDDTAAFFEQMVLEFFFQVFLIFLYAVFGLPHILDLAHLNGFQPRHSCCLLFSITMFLLVIGLIFSLFNKVYTCEHIYEQYTRPKTLNLIHLHTEGRLRHPRGPVLNQFRDKYISGWVYSCRSNTIKLNYNYLSTSSS